MKNSMINLRSKLRFSIRSSSATSMRVIGFIFLLLCVCAATGAVQIEERTPSRLPFVDPLTIDPKIPPPSSIIGFEVGEKAVRYDALMRYLEVLAASSDRITMNPFGKTHEGRTLVHLIITSPKNHQNLEQIKVGNAQLADPRKLPNPEAGKKLIQSHPATAIMAYSIHGDELSSTDAAMQLAYQLVAGTDERTKSLLDQVVTIIDPLQNPDGRERHLASIEQRTGEISSTDGQHIQHNSINGRTNHYRFDMNRDLISLVTLENQARMKVITKWNPHFMVDSHEMGAQEGYLMDPPRQPLNPLFPKKNLYWRQQYGFDQAAAFDTHGWSYYAKDWNVDFAPIYNASWINYSGGAGILYEQAGVSSAAYKQETGHILTYRESVHHQLVSSLANLNTLKNNRQEILTDYLEDHIEAVNGDGALTGTFLMPPHPDRARFARFIELLGRQSLEYSFTREAALFTNATDLFGNKTGNLKLPPGTLVVKSNQPFRRVAHALLRFDLRPDSNYLKIEREELENHQGSRFYDVTAWNLPMAFGLESYWVDEIPDLKLDSKPPTPADKILDWPSKPKYGYIIEFSSAVIYDVLVRLFEQNCHLRAATKSFVFQGHNYSPGTIVLRGHENPENLGAILQKIAQDLDVNIRPAQTASVGKIGPDLGGPNFILLHAPQIAILDGNMSNSAGAVWHLLDYRLKMRVSPIERSRDLRKYNVLILPGGGAVSDGLKKWVEDGGTLIALGQAVYSLARNDSEFSSVRRRRDVLDKLDVYQEDLEREQQADNITIDFDDLWGDAEAKQDRENVDQKKPTDKEEKPKISPSSGKPEELKRIDEWQRIFSPSGVFVKAAIDQRHWLGSGLGKFLPVMVGGSSVMMSLHPTQTPVRLVEEEDLRLSGLLWPEARKRLANSSFATVERLGRGQVILFATNPTSRGWYPAMERLFLNAVFLGPGMGTSQKMPW
ncbi:M14 family metallopeptidase [Acidobacteriota bacterium]